MTMKLDYLNIKKENLHYPQLLNCFDDIHIDTIDNDDENLTSLPVAFFTLKNCEEDYYDLTYRHGTSANEFETRLHNFTNLNFNFVEDDLYHDIYTIIEEVVNKNRQKRLS